MQLVVGNRLSHFADITGAITAQTAIAQLSKREKTKGYLLGQGLNELDTKMIKILGDAVGVPICILEKDERRAGRAVCHKHNSENQLISLPRKVADNVFEADLLVDDKNEIMSDHLTGLHLQGMLLIEATRQMFIAVGETQYTHLGIPSNCYVVFNRLNIGFEQFAFPLSTTIRQTVTSAKRLRDDRVGIAATIELFQEQGCVAKSDVEYTIFEAEAMRATEEKLARRAANKFSAYARKTIPENVEGQTIELRVAG